LLPAGEAVPYDSIVAAETLALLFVTGALALALVVSVVRGALLRGRFEAELGARMEAWRAAHERDVRRDAVERSRAVIAGKVSEHVVPYLPDFDYNPKDARFVGSPVDFVVFDGLDAGDLRRVVLLEVKTGDAAQLSRRERQIRDAVEAGRVEWQSIRVARRDGDG
jgi:predicted Holliday junction resolvase-like endonuclease